MRIINDRCNFFKTKKEESKMRRRFKEIIADSSSILSLVLIPALVVVFMLSAAGTAMSAAPSDPTGLAQYKNDGTTAIVPGGTTNQATVKIKATVTGDSAVQLQVEIIDGALTGITPNCFSPFVSSGSVATATCSGLSVGNYKWQVRTNDDTGLTSNWVVYGGDPDVIVTSNFLIHNSANLGTGTSLGTWGVDGETYGEFTCETCHTSSTSNTNIKMIKGIIETPDGTNWDGRASKFTESITFTQADGVNSDMGDATGSVPADFNGVCNVCHNSADHAHYAYNSSDNTHNVGSDCTACHQHRKAFEGLDCNGCHGETGGGAPILPGERVGVQDPYYDTTGQTIGAHPKHVTDQGITDCTVCHYGNTMPTVDKEITIGFSGTATDNSSVPSYDGVAMSNGYSYNGEVTTGTGTLDCSNVYCHSSVQGADGTGVPGSYATPDWGGGAVACDTCHGQATEEDGQPASGSHDMHAAAANEDYACSACHTGAGSGTAVHADGTIDMSIDATYGGTYDRGNHAAGSGVYGSCSTVYCHGDTLTAGTDTTPTWGGAVACGDCHGDDAATPPTAGSHVRHAGDAGGGLSRACTDCHGATAGGTGHTDADVSWDLSAIDASATYSGSNSSATGAKAPSVSYATCSTVYCHSNVQSGATGEAAPTLYESPTWGAASVTCDSCHGQAVEADGQPASGSHDKHAGAANKDYACSTCHNDGGDESANHANSTINLDIDDAYGVSAAYNGDTTPGSGAFGTCSSVNCHAGSDTPAWGGTLPNAADCSDCHGSVKGTLTGELEMSSGKHAAHIANGDAELATFDCGRCHASTVDTGDNKTITGLLHSDLSSDVVYDGLNGSAPDNTCTTVYCHSDGKGGYNNQVLADEWTGAATLDCTGCHGDTSSTYGEPDYASGTAGAADANSHSAHVSAAADCGSCHTSTTTTGTDITGALHINTTIDVTIADGYDDDADPANNYDGTDTVRTCSTVYCHSDGLGTYATPQWGDTSSGCDFCHADLPTSNGHDVHVQTAALAYGGTSVSSSGTTYDFGCGNCHPPLADEATKHRNGVVDITMDNTDGGALKSLNGVSGDATGYTQTQGSSVTCSAAYCHSKGDGTFDVTSPDWYAGSVSGSCDDCHGNSPSTNAHSVHVVGIHYDSIYIGKSGCAAVDVVVVNTDYVLAVRVCGW